MDLRPDGAFRRKLYDIIFESDTPAGRGFDVVLIVAIAASVLAALLESVGEFRDQYGEILRAAEWAFTIGFTIEYVVRLWVVRRPARYALSFFGVVDLLAILPGFVSLLVPGAQYLLVIRLLRVLRVFRILKLLHHLGEAELLLEALQRSRPKITVFLFTVLTLCVLLGSLMYLVEGPENGFKNIPLSVYWTIVTLTTVGYGDIAPATPLGRGLASMIMIMGYAIIAVPTGIVTVELGRTARPAPSLPGLRPCPACGREGHRTDAQYCDRCAAKL